LKGSFHDLLCDEPEAATTAQAALRFMQARLHQQPVSVEAITLE